MSFGTQIPSELLRFRNIYSLLFSARWKVSIVPTVP